MPGKTADCYNGAVLDRYSWSQNIREIEVKIPIPSSVTKGRDVGVEINTSHLKVWLKKEVSPVTGAHVYMFCSWTNLELQIFKRSRCE